MTMIPKSILAEFMAMVGEVWEAENLLVPAKLMLIVAEAYSGDPDPINVLDKELSTFRDVISRSQDEQARDALLMIIDSFMEGARNNDGTV